MKNTKAQSLQKKLSGFLWITNSDEPIPIIASELLNANAKGNPHEKSS